jgi:hypothetical protein
MRSNMITGLVEMFIALILIAVGFIIFPILIDGAEEIRLSANLSEYTGMASIVSIGPTLIFVFFLFGGGVLGFFGFRTLREG